MDIWQTETEKLENFIDKNDLRECTTQHSMFHFKISTHKNIIDIWCGKHKYQIKGEKYSRTYENVEELLELLK